MGLEYHFGPRFLDGSGDTPLPPMKCASKAREGLIAQKSAISALTERILRKTVGNKIAGGGYPIPGILQSVRKRLSSKELEETVV
jgi:hypothetical protein